MTSLGAFGEVWAAGHLARLGYQIIDRNVRCRAGEIDLIAWQGPTLVFVEVKTRRSTSYGSPEESITAARFGRLAKAIAVYLQKSGWEAIEYRVDVVALVVNGAGRVVEHRLLQGVEAPR